MADPGVDVASSQRPPPSCSPNRQDPLFPILLGIRRPSTEGGKEEFGGRSTSK